MNSFEAAALRLKQVLGVALDKEVAETLGFSPRAWAGKKKNNRFPEAELYALKVRRPDLSVDVPYVLTGQTQQQRAIESAASVRVTSRDELKQVGMQVAHAKEPPPSYRANADQQTGSAPGAGLTGMEQALVDALRHCMPEDRDTIIRLAKRLAFIHKPKG